ncbi:GntR family transcriptional regulator [Pseudonocardia lacus]|uniref:GntR family transcriptional regulator n=1 Tax=Pseudonocardia lacus TaxID=2835865 RepID=UPI001BDDC6BC|nr:GntR family transcriptional regulator [Pseudonocardia lacus]
MTAEVGPTALEATSLVELAVRRLRTEILSGALAPGERLVEEQLRTRFGTSRAPLREALRLLGQQGLVEHLPRRGVRVAELSPRDIEELFSLRDVLERFALECALGGGRTPDPAGLVALADAVAAMDAAVHAGDPLARDAAHRAFHTGLVALAGHRHLFEVYEPVILKLQLYMATNMRREADHVPPESGPARHRRLYDAVASGDLAAVLAELDAHGARTYLAPELDAH